MDKKKRTIVKYTVIIVAVFLLFVFTRESWGDIFAQLSKTSVKDIVVITIMSIGYFVLEGLIIRVFARKYNSEFTLVEGTACAYWEAAVESRRSII